MRPPFFSCPVRGMCYYERMTTPIILPVLDDPAREYACSHVEQLQGYINDYADGMVNDGMEIGDAVSNAHSLFCDFMLDNGFEPDNDQADGVASLIEACMLEVRRACAGRKRPKTFLHMEGYFKGADLYLMCDHIRQLSRIFTGMLALYRQDEADESHVIEYTAARFLELLEGEGCNVTPQLRQSVTEYAMLATLTVMAVELALSPRS